MGFGIKRRQCLYSVKSFTINVFMISVFTFLYIFVPFAWNYVPFNHSDLHFRNLLKQGVIFYNDVRLIEYLRQNFLIPPSDIYSRNTPTTTTHHYSSFKQDKFVDKLLNKKQNGFFIEINANNIEQLSNTLFLEKKRNWTGLLIEANPVTFKTLQHHHRNSYLSNTCVSNNKYAMEVDITSEHIISNVIKTKKKTVQCFPLMTYLMALNMFNINYFSLVISKGDELEVLKQIDFGRIQIDVFTIKYTHKQQQQHHTSTNMEDLKRIEKFLVDTGLYQQIKTVDSSHVALKRKLLS